MFPSNTKVLIVDDMRTMRILVKKTLTALGFTDITEADDGAKAWAEIEKSIDSAKPFQLIISDWNMPVMQGIELLRKVRADETIKKTPFLLLTAESERSQALEAIQAGVSGYVLKPFTTDALKEKLTAIHSRTSMPKSA